MLFSILIPAFNEEHYLPETLSTTREALEKVLPDHNEWEIIVCDNNSSDRTAEMARTLGATVVFEPVNQIARARNTAARAASGEWLIFLDADTHPNSGLLQEIMAGIRNFPLVGFGSTIRVIRGSLFNRLRLERLNFLYRLFQMSGGAFLGCRRSAFEAIGGFGEQYYAIEELDFLLRLKKFGRKTGQRFNVFYHHPVLTSGRKGEMSGRAMFRLFVSNVLAVLLVLFQWALPRRWVHFMGQRWLTYWYSGQRNTPDD